MERSSVGLLVVSGYHELDANYGVKGGACVTKKVNACENFGNGSIDRAFRVEPLPTATLQEQHTKRMLDLGYSCTSGRQ
jgi:hypothetical protein